MTQASHEGSHFQERKGSAESLKIAFIQLTNAREQFIQSNVGADSYAAHQLYLRDAETLQALFVASSPDYDIDDFQASLVEEGQDKHPDYYAAHETYMQRVGDWVGMMTGYDIVQFDTNDEIIWLDRSSDDGDRHKVFYSINEQGGFDCSAYVLKKGNFWPEVVGGGSTVGTTMEYTPEELGSLFTEVIDALNTFINQTE